MKTLSQFVMECICSSNQDKEYLEEKNKPTSPEKWARAKAQAKSKFDVYPSAYANAWAAKKYKSMGGGWKSVSEEVEDNVQVKESKLNPNDPHGDYTAKSKALHDLSLNKDVNQKEVQQRKLDLDKEYAKVKKEEVEQIDEKSAAWQRKEGKNPEGGLNQKGVESYRRENPGSKLQTAVTTKPSKLKPGSKAANRRKSFCARMSGMKKRLTSAKTANDPDSRINKSLRKWNC